MSIKIYQGWQIFLITKIQDSLLHKANNLLLYDKGNYDAIKQKINPRQTCSENLCPYILFSFSFNMQLINLSKLHLFDIPTVALLGVWLREFRDLRTLTNFSNLEKTSWIFHDFQEHTNPSLDTPKFLHYMREQS